MNSRYDIEILSAPSILGLSSNGVDELGGSLLDNCLAEKLQVMHPVAHVPTFNEKRSTVRGEATRCLNAELISDFSLALCKIVTTSLSNKRFPMVLGGDCSILIGIMAALKARGNYGLIFLDAHADFYEPERSPTGEVADMDLAIVTGRGPASLSNINGLQPYVKDEHVIHIGQRDWDETKKYGSQDIRDTAIKCFSLGDIEEDGISISTREILEQAARMPVDGFWIHFDTDVLNDEVNPAVDYRLPGGLFFDEAEHIIKALLRTGRIAGMDVTIFNPSLDTSGEISKNITESIVRVFPDRRA